jgi:hypothetical protein
MVAQKPSERGEAAVVALARRSLCWSVAARGIDSNRYVDNRRQRDERRRDE